MDHPHFPLLLPGFPGFPDFPGFPGLAIQQRATAREYSTEDRSAVSPCPYKGVATAIDSPQKVSTFTYLQDLHYKYHEAT
jgi:hypothetical protein